MRQGGVQLELIATACATHFRVWDKTRFERHIRAPSVIDASTPALQQVTAMSPANARIRIATQISRQLERAESPRVQMSLLVLLTAISGFVASSVLLNLGMHAMGWRYLAAFAIAYAVFLLLLRLWIAWRRDPGSGVDLGDVPLPEGSGPAPIAEAHPAPGAGLQSGGNGGSSGSGDALGTSLDAASSADEFAIVVFIVLGLLALLCAAAFVVYSAPALFAELMLDAGLGAGLYHRLHRVETNYWLTTAVRRTAWPFVATALMVAGCGAGLQAAYPDVQGLGDLF